jgi:hypothetical protein
MPILRGSKRLATLLALTATIVGGCATLAPLSNDGPAEPFRRFAYEEYRQLSQTRLKGLPNRSTRTHFMAKARTALTQDCLEPERLEDWPRSASATVQRGGKALSLAEVRMETVGLLRGAPFVDLPAPSDLQFARAHLLGRYDCIVAFSREATSDPAVEICVQEWIRSSTYLRRGVAPSDPADARERLCPAKQGS